MKVITSLSITRTNTSSKDPWPHTGKHLVVVVWQSDPSSNLLAIGVDPDPGHAPGHAPGHDPGQIVFEAELPPARLSAFLKAAIDSERGELERHCHRITPTPGGHHVDDPRALRDKASLALARALRSDEGLAEAVVTPAPPRPPRPSCETPAGKVR
jgi:hypothetical protein